MIDDYLRRIGYDGPRETTPEVLRALHLQHLFTVPFENLDISRGRRIVPDPARSMEKIVREHRGGFCYELNGAFSLLLRAFGFEVDLLSGRVARADGGFGPEFDHMALHVRCGDGSRWLADVGFGESFLAPLSFEGNDDGKYRVAPHEDRYSMQVFRDGEWKHDYLFTLTPHDVAEYAEMCHYHQTSPLTSFTKGDLCSLARPNGRITAQRDRIIVTEDGVKRETPLTSDEEYGAALRDLFGIRLSF